MDSGEEESGKNKAQLDLTQESQINGTNSIVNNNYKPNGVTTSSVDKKVEANCNLQDCDINNAANEKLDNKAAEKKTTRDFLNGVLLDLMNKDLLPLKILFFFKYATLFVLYPFMPLHIKSLGMSATEAGINAAVVPIFVVMAPPFSGMLADKIGNFRVFLTGMTLLNAPFALALLLVPAARQIVPLPKMLTFVLSCSSIFNPYPVVLQNIDNITCQLTSNYNQTLFSTPVVCGTIQNNADTQNIPVYFRENVSSSNLYILPDKSVFQPYKGKHLQFMCESSSECNLRLEPIDKQDWSQATLNIDKLVLISKNANTTSNKTGLKFGAQLKYQENITLQGSPKCLIPNEVEDTRNSHEILISVCITQLRREQICSNENEEEVYNVPLTFGLYTLLRIFLGIASATSFIMFEGAVIAILKEHGGDYGLQRVTATLAAIIFAPLSGILIQSFGSFHPAFYLYAILQLISGILTLKIDLTFKRPTEKILGHLKEVLTQIEIIIFFAAMLLSGAAWGYLESFLFWFLKDLGGSNFLMGLTISVGGFCGIPLLILSRPIIKKLGHVNVLCIGLVFYSFRLFGYSFIEDPWLCLPFEAMEAITASLAITAAATYAAALSSSETIASIQGIWGSLYFGFGRGAGSLMGGFFHKWYGARNTFRIFSLISLFGGILYFIINYTYIRKYSTRIRTAKGLNLNDIRGDKQKREAEVKSSSIGATFCEFDGGYVGPCDSEFTDIPLDEVNPSRKS